MSGSGRLRYAGTNTFSATIVLLPVAAMPLAYQSSTIVRSRLLAMTHVGTPAPLSVVRTALSTVHSAPWHPVLKGHRPFTRKPPSTETAVPVGEKTPLIRG